MGSVRRSGVFTTVRTNGMEFFNPDGTAPPVGAVLGLKPRGVVVPLLDLSLNSLSVTTLVAETVIADDVSAGTVTAGTVIAGDVSAGTVTAATIIAGDVSAGTITTGNITLIGDCASIQGSVFALKWIKQMAAFNTPGVDMDNNTNAGNIISKNLRCVVCDTSGNSYVAYSTTGTIPTQIGSGAIDIVVAKFDSNGTLVWITQSGSFNTAIENTIPSIAIDENGFIYVSYTDTFPESVRYFKLDPISGATLWATSLPTSNGLTSSSIHAANNNVYVTASYGVLGIGPNVSCYDTATGTSEISIANFERNVWDVETALSQSHLYALMCEFDPAVGSIAINNIHIAKMDLLTNAITHGTNDALFNPFSWIIDWIYQVTCGPSLAIGPDGHPILSYLTISNTPSTTYSGAGVDMVIAKLDANTLSPYWVTQFSTGFTDTSVLTVYSSTVGTSIITDTYGNIIALYTTTGADVDLRITVLSPSGTILSTIIPPMVNTPAADYIPSVTLVPNSNDIVLAYRTNGTVPGGISPGNGDLAIARFTSLYSPVVLQPDGGYVGIGTCTPQYTLDVSGSIRSTSLLTGGITADLPVSAPTLNNLVTINTTTKQLYSQTGTYLGFTGEVRMWAGPTAPPSGWLLCNGGAYSAIGYPALFAVIGTTYGNTGGDFQVPNIPAVSSVRYIIKT